MIFLLWKLVKQCKSTLDCKTVHIFVYSRLLRHTLLISLLTLRKKPTVVQSKSALKNHIINLFIPQYSYLIAQSTLKMPHNFCFFITPNQKARQSEIKINRLLWISVKIAPTQGIGWMVICMKLSTQAVSSFHCVFTGAKYRKGLFCGNK